LISTIPIDFDDAEEQGDLEDEMAVVEMGTDFEMSGTREEPEVMVTVRAFASDATEVCGCEHSLVMQLRWVGVSTCMFPCFNMLCRLHRDRKMLKLHSVFQTIC
jgi:hypothetical protein